jgi:hypothetical protein
MLRNSLRSFLMPAVSLIFLIAAWSPGAAQEYYLPNDYYPNNYEVYCYYLVGAVRVVIPNCSINLSTVANQNTNAHLHNASRPSSYLTPNSLFTGPSGISYVSLTTTTIGQQERIVLQSPGRPTEEITIQVGYDDIFYNHHPEIWDKVGGSDTGANTGHGTTDQNRWMESNAAYGIYDATTDYLSIFPEQGKLCLNDMGLPFGGRFDINQDWEGPHYEHDRGKAVDVGDSSAPQCATKGTGIPVPMKENLRITCVTNGALDFLSYLETGHIHCSWGLQ